MKARAICISAGMLQPKKADNPLARLHTYLNYGLLGLAGLLSKDGHNTRVFHGRFHDPIEFVQRLHSQGFIRDSDVILLSLPSSFSIPWARAASDEIRRLAPAVRIVVGGRWVVADDPGWVASMLPAASQVEPGLAEGAILDVVRSNSSGVLRIAPSVSFPKPDYALLDELHEFQPSVEVSRGCGMHCNFCAEAEVPLSNLKSPRRVAQEIEDYRSLVNSDDFHPYFEASIFRPTTDWANQLGRELESHGIRVQWRAESRVDVMSDAILQALVKCGLRVIDLGLESASSTQLRAMRKTRKPDAYLRRAAALLAACRDAGVWAKVNVLLYPGESEKTLAETREWLERHRDCIKGVSAGPTILYRFGSATASTVAQFESQGATLVDSQNLNSLGYTHLHLSPEISHERAIDEATSIAKSFMTAKDYFDLKSFSYLPRGFGWDDFMGLVNQTPADRLSFSL